MIEVNDWINNKQFIVPGVDGRDGSDYDHWSYSSDHTLIHCYYWNCDILQINTETEERVWLLNM